MIVLKWRIFIDNSPKGLKADLLYYGNIYPSIPCAYLLQIKDDYKNVKQLLKQQSSKCQATAHFSHTIMLSLSDMFMLTSKCLGFLLGLQGGCTNILLLLCL